MKISVLTMMFVMFILAGCQKSQPPLATAIIQAPTMLCGMCARTIEKAVKSVEGVAEVSVDVEKKQVEIKYASLGMQIDRLESAITAAGYDANDKKRDPEAYERLPACCKTNKQ